MEFSDLLRNPHCFSVGTPTCFALVRVVADAAELLTIATRPTDLRRGLARNCMVQWQDVARQRGATRAFLEVAADNAAAIGLYRACGFETTSKRPAYYRRVGQDPVDALLMSHAFDHAKPDG